ncbi:subtilisin-like protease [Olea europaea subsp. europaea]|uniref:Subtilisin-like protease n=1 Tax=Olea europaea subsp. europaea TaxID=158383 RepID=A0A8S0RF02_OLEEU|nr:subtilisin-like protease [Olea europaea subsp. europaea]
MASYSSRGPDVNNALLETTYVLKPTIMAPGSSIWAAWSPLEMEINTSKGKFCAIVWN